MCDFKTLLTEILQFRDERDWAQFHTPKNLATALRIEVAELQEFGLEIMRDASGRAVDQRYVELSPRNREAYRYPLGQSEGPHRGWLSPRGPTPRQDRRTQRRSRVPSSQKGVARSGHPQRCTQPRSR